MSKKYKGKTCAYCAVPGSSETGDHIIAREFFLPERREHLPQVPACHACNNTKSVLEHYLMAVLPFGGRHADASVNLTKMVQPRLEKNLSLARKLQSGREVRYTSCDGLQWTPEIKLPLDGDKAKGLFEMITKGLVNFHWKQNLSDKDCRVCASFLTHDGETMFQRLWNSRAADRVRGDLGGGTFVYDGMQASDDPRLTFWRMSLYGVVVGGDAGAPNEKSTMVFSFTAPRRLQAASDLAEILSSRPSA